MNWSQESEMRSFMEAKLLKWTRWMLMLLLLVLVTGCDNTLEVSVVTKTATLAPFTPAPTPGITLQATPAESPTSVNTVAAPTSTPIPQPTGVPTSAPPLPTATPPPPTPTVEPAPTRIRFEPGATSATVAGHIRQNGIDRYVLRALAGQTMEVRITSPDNDVLLDIWGADGTVLKRHPVGEAYWAGPLPATQDYFIGAVSVGGETDYLLTVTISALEPEATRIQFEPGATSATVTGHVEGHAVERYVLRALAGQTMDVAITSPNNDVLLTIVGADGIPLKRYVDGMAEWRGVLPATQDYFIDAVSVGEATGFQLTVTVSRLEPEPTRIQFSPGATSAAIQASLQPGVSDRYVLGALRGQRMEVHVSSSASIDITVQGRDGSIWSAPAPGGTLSIEALPATQDYIITLALPVPLGGPVSYTLEISISPL
jgi:hypothetical protein